jgi:hypothetical protein
MPLPSGSCSQFLDLSNVSILNPPVVLCLYPGCHTKHMNYHVLFPSCVAHPTVGRDSVSIISLDCSTVDWILVGSLKYLSIYVL